MTPEKGNMALRYPSDRGQGILTVWRGMAGTMRKWE